jgi:uncharacterized membrane protein YjdF
MEETMKVWPRVLFFLLALLLLSIAFYAGGQAHANYFKAMALPLSLAIFFACIAAVPQRVWSTTTLLILLFVWLILMVIAKGFNEEASFLLFAPALYIAGRFLCGLKETYLEQMREQR